MKSKPTTEGEHIRRMSTDRAYAESFLKNSAAPDTEFTVVFKCKDPLQTVAIFQAAHARLALPIRARRFR